MTSNPAIAANLYSYSSTHATHTSFHVLVVLALLAYSIALLNYYNLIKQLAILLLFYV
jgi:hypothetical protein